MARHPDALHEAVVWALSGAVPRTGEDTEALLRRLTTLIYHSWKRRQRYRRALIRNHPPAQLPRFPVDSRDRLLKIDFQRAVESVQYPEIAWKCLAQGTPLRRVAKEVGLSHQEIHRRVKKTRLELSAVLDVYKGTRRHWSVKRRTL